MSGQGHRTAAAIIVGRRALTDAGKSGQACISDAADDSNTVASRLPPQHNTRYQVRHFLTYSLSHRDRGSDAAEYAIDNMEERHCFISLQVPSMLSLDPSSSRSSVVCPRDVVGQYHLSGGAEHAKLCYEGYETRLLEQSQYRAQVISTSLGLWVCNNFSWSNSPQT